MKITDIKFRTPINQGNLKAYIDITFDDCFIVHNAKIIKGKTGLIIAMPAEKRNKKFIDKVHPITTEFRKYITEEVVTKYTELNK